MRRLRVIPSLVCLIIFAVGCEETLPLRTDPTSYLAASMQMLYVYNTLKENSLYMFLVLKNNYDETL